MTSKDLRFTVLVVLIILLTLIITFFLTVNLLRVITFIVKIDSALKSTENATIKDYSIKYNDLDPYDSEKLGYKNYLYEINGTEWGDGINIMLIGSDKRSYHDKKARADVIIVLRINSLGKILSISIPRDTLVELNDGIYKGEKDKIGHSYYWEGLDGLKKSIETILNSPIYKTIIIDNFRTLEVFLEIVGDININHFNSQKGIVWLRNRNFKEGDIERCKRQQLFLKKAVEKLWSMTFNGNYLYSSFLFDAIKKTIYTDITVDDLYKIIYLLKENNFNPNTDFFISILPGYFGKYDSKLLLRKNLDCWIADEVVLKRIQFLFYSTENINFLPEKIDKSELIKSELSYYFYKKSQK